ncbi:MAG: glycoside hydrolase family 16 protein, partial [Pseudomonadota bacterium]
SPNRSFFSTLVIPAEGYVLHFADEFDDHHNGKPNPQHWDYKTGSVINDEQQCYTDDHPSYVDAGISNVAVETRQLDGQDNGVLVLSLKKETVSCIQAGGDTFHYTSGAVSTRMDDAGAPYLVDMPHGMYEIRAKIPPGRGTWPAIWLLGKKDYTPDDPVTIGWPDAGEIDIMEAVGFEEANGLYRLHHTLHRNRDGGFLWPHRRPNRTGQGMTVSLNEPPSARFHVYRMIWTPGSIEFFVDDQRVRTMDLGDGVTGERDGFFRNAPDMNGWGHPNTTADDHLGWPYAMEAGNRFKLIMNLAWGGGWGGQQGLDNSIFNNDQAVEMLVDYVRVYVPAAD